MELKIPAKIKRAGAGRTLGFYRFYLQGPAPTREFSDLFKEIVAWCEEQFGEQDGLRWQAHHGLNDISVAEHADATALMVRWG